MKVSKRCQYALRALLDMGMAQAAGRALVRIGDLAETENLPVKFLEQIFVQLKEAGYIESKRGKQGGYLLAQPASEITFGQVIRLMDGSLAPVSCASRSAYEPCSCPEEAYCGLRSVMVEAERALSGVLDHTTLADTVKTTLRKIRRNQATLPFVQRVLHPPSKKTARKVAKKKIAASPKKRRRTAAASRSKKPSRPVPNRKQKR